MAAHVEYLPIGQSAFRCMLTTSSGRHLTLEGAKGELDPKVTGDEPLVGNPALISNLWAYTKDEFLYRRARNKDRRAMAEKSRSHYLTLAKEIAELTDQVSTTGPTAWCSACFHKSTHRRIKGWNSRIAVHLCDSCGTPTTQCAAPQCNNMAMRGTGRFRGPAYCAEHRHEIPGFEKAEQRLDTLDECAAWLTFEKKNLSRATKVTAVSIGSAVLVAPLAFWAAPAIGGILGSSALGGGLTGAAATSHGLAMLGGGALGTSSVAFGMAGGTAVVTAAGGALGGALGASATSAYVRSDKSFRIEKLRDGSGPTVLIASGFLTEGSTDWGTWRKTIDAHFPESPVYRVHWGSRELKDLGSLAAIGGQAAATRWAASMAARATTKGAAKLPWIGSVVAARGLAANPWAVARTRADMTGAVLADLLARIDTGPFILVGHSLGARVMLRTAQLLGTKDAPPRLQSVHLLGAAVGSKGDWRTLGASVTGTVWNYYSEGDRVLGSLYKYAQFGSPAAGSVGLKPASDSIKNVNVTKSVSGHSDYFGSVRLRPEAS